MSNDTKIYPLLTLLNPPKKTKANQKTNIIFTNNDLNLPPLAETLDLLDHWSRILTKTGWLQNFEF